MSEVTTKRWEREQVCWRCGRTVRYLAEEPLQVGGPACKQGPCDWGLSQVALDLVAEGQKDGVPASTRVLLRRTAKALQHAKRILIGIARYTENQHDGTAVWTSRVLDFLDGVDEQGRRF